MTDAAELPDDVAPAATVEAEFHYTTFADADTFAALVRRHGLEYAGITDHYGATPFVWGKNPGGDEQVLLATGCHPVTGEFHAGGYREEGYASYIYLAGPAHAAEPLYQDIHETAERIKGEFQPLAPTEGGDENDDREQVVMTDGGRDVCDTLGCENPPVEGGFCEECTAISPGILADAETVGDPERETDDSPDTPRERTAEPGSGDANPGGEPGRSWSRARFDDLESGVWPPALLDREQWMGHVEKKPFAPWADRDHPEADADEDARWKWGLVENYAGGDTLAVAEDDHRLDGRAFIQREADPFAYVDGDDVRDPDTGDVHPGFIEVLDRLGLTYADVSQSGSGAHAVYRGELPEGVKQAAWQLDTEPFGDHDDEDLPSVEIYAGKRVCVATGEHVRGTPVEAREWDKEALREVLDENDQLPEPVSHPDDAREEFDADEYEPTATSSGETTDDMRDLFAALDRLDARRVAGRTIVAGWNDEASTSGEKRAFRPTWGANSNGTANVVDSRIWQDTGDEAGYGGPVVMALIHAGEISPRNATPRVSGAKWWKGVEALRALGFDVPEYDPPDDGPGSADTEPVAMLPNSPRARASANGWDWMTADRAGVDDALTVEDARERTREAIGDTYRRSDRVLVEALPTMGKSHGAVAAAADAGEPITMLTTRGNREQYAQIKEWCEEHGLKAKVLPSFLRDCETANGEFGDGVAETVRQWYRRGATGKDIHIHYEDETREPIPCDGPAGARCSYKAGWQFDADEYDVLIGHYLHGHVSSATHGRTVVFDEFPGDAFETALGGDDPMQRDAPLAGPVTRYLKTTDDDALPYDDYADLFDGRDDPERRATALAHFEDHDPDRDAAQAFDRDGHALAPLAAYTILAGAGDGNDLGNGWERASLPGTDGGIGLFDRESGRVHLLRPPELDSRYTHGVVALDGTPTPKLWELALGTRLNHRAVLTDDERVEYLRDALGINLIRTTENVKPYSSDPTHPSVGTDDTGHVDVEGDTALLDGIADKHGQRPALITTARAEDVYDREGVLDRDEDREFAGSEYVADARHHGNLKGSNDLADCRLGAVIGSRSFGDGFVKKWGAFAGEATERVGDGKGVDLEYSGFGAAVYRHMTHHETLQAALRFGRDGGGAVVYVHTNTLPEWVEDGALAGEGRVIRTRSDGERQVLDALESDAIGEEWTTAELAEHPAVEVSEDQVRRHLHRFAREGYVAVGVEGNGFVWCDDGLHRVAEHGEVELGTVELAELTEEETDCIARTTIYTWGAITSGSPSVGESGEDGPAVETGGRTARDAVDPPPERPD